MDVSVIVETNIRRVETVKIKVPEDVKAEYIEAQKISKQRAEDLVTDYILSNRYQDALDLSVHEKDSDMQDSAIIGVQVRESV